MRKEKIKNLKKNYYYLVKLSDNDNIVEINIIKFSKNYVLICINPSIEKKYLWIENDKEISIFDEFTEDRGEDKEGLLYS